MNNEVNFFTLFKRFEPTEEQRALLSQATDIHRQIDKENRRVKARFFLPQTVEKELLYEIEQGIAVAYELNGVFLMPRYPTECFNKEYFRQIVKESERVGSVSKGFFDEYSYDFDGEKREILLHLPWGTGGISLLQRAKICETLEQIIESEFGVRYEVRIKQGKSAEKEYEDYSADQKSRLKEMMKGGFAAPIPTAPPPASGGYGGGFGGGYGGKKEEAPAAEPRFATVF